VSRRVAAPALVLAPTQPLQEQWLAQDLRPVGFARITGGWAGTGSYRHGCSNDFPTHSECLYFGIWSDPRPNEIVYTGAESRNGGFGPPINTEFRQAVVNVWPPFFGCTVTVPAGLIIRLMLSVEYGENGFTPSPSRKGTPGLGIRIRIRILFSP
jgi:hypothetical protein